MVTLDLPETAAPRRAFTWPEAVPFTPTLLAELDDTDARDTAYNALKSYMKELQGTARGARRGKNGLLAKLGL